MCDESGDHSGRSLSVPCVVICRGARDQLRKLAEMTNTLAITAGVRQVCFRKNVDAGAVQEFLLQTKLAFALGKLFVGQFAVEGDDVWSEFSEALRQDNAAFGKIFASKFGGGSGGAFHQVGQTNAKFDDALVVVIIKWLGNYAAFVENRPELICATGVVMPNPDGRFAGIAAHDDQLHAFS